MIKNWTEEDFIDITDERWEILVSPAVESKVIFNEIKALSSNLFILMIADIKYIGK